MNDVTHADGQAMIGRETAHKAGAPILDVENLTVTYGRVHAIHSVSFRLEEGD